MSKRRDFAGFHTRTPNEARVVDYFLGGKDNFAADRKAAEQAVALAPELPMMALESRRFLGRVVRFLAGEGIRQFVDIGCGLPTQNNAHEVAQAAAPESRVVYVDFDPVVVTHARAILADDVRTSVVQADMRDPDLILGHPDLVRLIDLKRPVAILLISALQAIPEDEVALDVTTRLRERICPGSWMVISHPVSDSRPDVTEQLATMFQDEKIVKGTRRRDNLRSQAEIEPYFDGLELADPGIVRTPAWRPDRGEPRVDPETVWSIVGVGRKP
ncbi:SAM-dependent methyltransferase [Actinoallomurus oryzae]|uniref:SAM-dependent methyltransferase n=1 Tax=Actinoallomurus oryzae TaxID=502180 RepID=A0ABP8QZZ8_9ACTN